jgi:hypothetical protein
MEEAEAGEKSGRETERNALSELTCENNFFTLHLISAERTKKVKAALKTQVGIISTQKCFYLPLLIPSMIIVFVPSYTTLNSNNAR